MARDGTTCKGGVPGRSCSGYYPYIYVCLLQKYSNIPLTTPNVVRFRDQLLIFGTFSLKILVPPLNMAYHARISQFTKLVKFPTNRNSRNHRHMSTSNRCSIPSQDWILINLKELEGKQRKAISKSRPQNSPVVNLSTHSELNLCS